jgi:rubredoxin
MKCGFCDYEFDPDEAETACQSCPLVKGCHLIRCPQCGYEMPPEPKLITWLRNAGTKKNLIHSKGD